MNYWLIKGQPKENKFNDMLVPLDIGTWRTKNPLPTNMNSEDIVYIWASSPQKEIIGIAKFVEKLPEKNKNGENQFNIEYLTPVIDKKLNIDFLRKDIELNIESTPSFLKSGAAGTVFHLTNNQGERLNQIISDKNSAIPIFSDAINFVASDIESPPKRIKTTVNRIIRDTKKSQELKEKYKHKCQICNERIIVSPGKFYSEAHHVRPLGNPHNGDDMIENMIVLCPNHHAMFDLAIPKFISNKEVSICGVNLKINMLHDINTSNIKYHNTLCK